MLREAFESFLEKTEQLKKEYYQDTERIEAKYKKPKLNCDLDGMDRDWERRLSKGNAGFKTRKIVVMDLDKIDHDYQEERDNSAVNERDDVNKF